MQNSALGIPPSAFSPGLWCNSSISPCEGDGPGANPGFLTILEKKMRGESQRRLALPRMRNSARRAIHAPAQRSQDRYLDDE